MDLSPDENANSELRRIGLMQQIVNGAKSCVQVEHAALYRLIRTSCPAHTYTVNRNGVFVPLQNIPTEILEQCHALIQHGHAQMKKEVTRQQREKQITRSLLHK